MVIDHLYWDKENAIENTTPSWKNVGEYVPFRSSRMLYILANCTCRVSVEGTDPTPRMTCDMTIGRTTYPILPPPQTHRWTYKTQQPETRMWLLLTDRCGEQNWWIAALDTQPLHLSASASCSCSYGCACAGVASACSDLLCSASLSSVSTAPV